LTALTTGLNSPVFDALMLTIPRIKSSLVPWAAIGVILFLSHFLLVTEFGLYEDDYFYILPHITENFREFAAFFVSTVTHPPQGRPLFTCLQGALAYFGYHAGGLVFCHLISFVFLWLSAGLLYQLLQKKLSHRAAFLAALLLVLFPLDTSRQILMHQMATVTTTTVLLCAFHLYVTRRFVLSYLVAATLLITYESIFLPFIVAPFLLDDQPRKLVQRFLIHTIVFVAIVGIVFGSRALLGESRALETSSHLADEIPKMVWSCIASPALGIWAIIARPVDALMHSRGEGCIVALLAGLTTFFLLRALWGKGETSDSAPGDVGVLGAAGVFPRDSAPRRTVWLILCGGMISWVIVYALDFRPDYYPPGITIGRLSAMHGIAGFGAALVVAAMVSLLIDLVPQRLRIGIDIGGALFVAGLAAFGFHIQDTEYVASWQQQRDFWLGLVPLIQDAQPNDNIVLQIEYRRHGLIPYTQGFTADEMTVYPNLAFPYFVDFPGDRQQSPTFHGYADYTKIIEENGETIIQSPFFSPARFAHIHGNNLILLRAQDGMIHRVQGEVTLGGHTMFARPMGPVTGNPIKMSRLFWELFEPSSSSSWFTLRSAKSAPPW
jgi:hypothetical protein